MVRACRIRSSGHRSQSRTQSRPAAPPLGPAPGRGRRDPAAFGIPQQQLSQSQAAGTLARLAATQNVSLVRVRSIALAAADPVLDEAMRAGVISDAERRALRWRIRERGVV